MPLLSKSTLFSVAIVFSATFLSPQAHASLWTFTTTGIIGYGYDADGIFFKGQRNTYLSGQSFELTTIVDPSLYSNQTTYAAILAGNSWGNSFSTTVTINGITKTFEMGASSGGQSYGGQYFISNEVTQYGPSYPKYLDYAEQRAEGATNNGTHIRTEQYVYSYVNSMELDLSSDQAWSYTPQTTDSQYTDFYHSSNGFAYFQACNFCSIGGKITGISINALGISVPEPNSLYLLGFALAIVVGIQRKIKIIKNNGH